MTPHSELEKIIAQWFQENRIWISHKERTDLYTILSLYVRKDEIREKRVCDCFTTPGQFVEHGTINYCPNCGYRKTPSQPT